MGKSSKKSINSNRPARRARRGTAAATETVATAAVTPAADDVTAAAPVSEAATADAPATEAAPAPSRQDVQQLAFYYYAESGYVNGNALDHWLRAEHDLASS
jgi:hypothetical protein